MLPTEQGFARAMSELGIKQNDQLVVYNTQELGIFSAPRVGWILRVFGNPNVRVLNNFRLWVEQEYPTETGPDSAARPSPSSYPTPTTNPDIIIHFGGIKEIVKDYGKKGSGVMAAALETALNEAGFGPRGERRVYDGSWT